MQEIFNLELLSKRKQNTALHTNNYNHFFKHIYLKALSMVNDTAINFENAINFGYKEINIIDYVNKNKVQNLYQADENEQFNNIKQNSYLFNENTINNNIIPINFFNLIISIHCFNNYNNLQNVINYSYKLLKSNSMILLVLPIDKNLNDLVYILMKTDLETNNNFYSRVHPFTSLQTIGSVLQIAGFTNIVALKDTTQITYKHPLGVFKDLKYTASSNILLHQQKGLLGKKWYNNLLKNLEEHKKNNLYSFNTEYAIISAWKN